MRFFSFLFIICIFIFSTLFGALLYTLYTPWFDSALYVQPSTTEVPSIVLDDEGVEWMRFQKEQHTPVPLHEIPLHIRNAFLATEDRTFYTHTGISWTGIARSILHNIYHRKFAQGASTITQQLVRRTFFDTKKTVVRKIKEQCYAYILEQQYTKDHILEWYLNSIYFGNGIYGISAAAQRFWQKPVSALTVDEGAILAGIVRSPATYCPLLHPVNTLKRRNVVLQCMQQAGYLSVEECRSLKGKPLTISYDAPSDAPHFRAMLRSHLEKQLGKHALYTQGFTIKITLNRTMQQTATRIFTQHVEQLRQSTPQVDGALVTLHGETGAIKALVGGCSYKQSQFNRATEARRQLGSVFKPFIYATALDTGLSLTDVLVDEPITLSDHGITWSPRNVTRTFKGPMTRARALTTSNNIIALKTLTELGIETVISQAAKIPLAVDPYPSIALGCVECTPLQAAAFFNIFPRTGCFVEPYLIDWIKTREGKKVYAHHVAPTRIFSWETASSITHLLTGAVDRWKTYPKMPPCSITACGKTGTTNDARNCWFVGATPSWTTALYLGADDNSSLGELKTLRSAFPLWLAYNEAIQQPRSTFSYAPHLVRTTINAWSGTPVSPDVAEHPEQLELLVPAAATTQK